MCSSERYASKGNNRTKYEFDEMLLAQTHSHDNENPGKLVSSSVLNGKPQAFKPCFAHERCRADAGRLTNGSKRRQPARRGAALTLEKVRMTELDRSFPLKPLVQCALVVLFAPIMACAQAGETMALRRDVGVLLGRLHEAGDFSGAVMIGRQGRVVYGGAFGAADQTRAFALDTAADGASLAKTVTAAAIWRLIGEGSIAIDDPVNAHVAEFPYADVTIRHLLSHTAGLPDYDPFEALVASGAVMDNLALQARMRQIAPRPLHEPGAAFTYCNICYDTLALLIERVTGQSYEEYAVAGLLGRLGADDAFLRPRRFSDWPQARTLGFRSSLRGAEIFDVFDNEAFYGGSNIYVSVRDLHAWASAWAHRRVLPAPVIENALEAARIGADVSAITLSSWYCAPARERCYYTGHHQGFFSFVYWDASRDLTVVFVSNNTMAPPLQPWLMRTLIAFAEARDREPMPFASPDALEIDFDRVSGRYRLSDIGDVRIGADEGGAMMAVDDGPRYQLYQVGHGILYAPGVDAYLSFESFDGGANQRLRWTSVFTKGAGLRLPP